MNVGGVCLQGGAEFGPRCAEMDADVLARAGAGPVVVTALAGRVGADYAAATGRGVRWYRQLGAPDVRAAPDAREADSDAYQACRHAGLLVLPGGSPRRLLAALTGTRMGLAVQEVLAAGGAVSGASAGAMVLCSVTFLPETGTTVRGLGLVADSMVLPHFRGDLSWARRAALAPATWLFGLPEQSGVWVSAGRVTGLGADPATVGPASRQVQLARGQSLDRE